MEVWPSFRWNRKVLKALYIAIAVILGNYTAELLISRWTQGGKVERVQVVSHNVELSNRSKAINMIQLRPVIGIVGLGGRAVTKGVPKSRSIPPRYTQYGNSYIPASYAKFFQSGGMVIPISDTY